MITLTVRSAAECPHAALRLLSFQTALRNMERLKPSAPSTFVKLCPALVNPIPPQWQPNAACQW